MGLNYFFGKKQGKMNLKNFFFTTGRESHAPSIQRGEFPFHRPKADA